MKITFSVYVSAIFIPSFPSSWGQIVMSKFFPVRVDFRSEGHNHSGKQQEGLELFSFVKLEEKLADVPILIKMTV